MSFEFVWSCSWFPNAGDESGLSARMRARSIAPMRELRPGVWHWQSPHPGWNEEEWWPELVSSYAIELGDDLLLFDPLSVSRRAAPPRDRRRPDRAVPRPRRPSAWPPGAHAARGHLAGLGREVRHRSRPRARHGERRSPRGCARVKGKDTSTVTGAWAVRYHRVRGPRGQRPHSLAAVDQRDRDRRLALRLRRRTDIQLGGRKHVTRNDVVRGNPSAARPAGRARAAGTRRADGSRSARTRAVLNGTGQVRTKPSRTPREAALACATVLSLDGGLGARPAMAVELPPQEA